MKFTVPHQFSEETAVSHLKHAIDEMRPKLLEKVAVEEERWEGSTLHFAFTVEKQQIKGQVAVKDKAFAIEAKLPFMLRLFEGQIQKAIETQVQQALKERS